MTARIAALTESLRLKGFYQAGAGDVGAAIEVAFAQSDDMAIMVPVPTTAAFGPGGIRDAIQWLPLGEVVQTITACLQARKAAMEDVYEVTGISDIMRGQTAASETLGAQRLKSQYGSVRVQEGQNELATHARDVLRIVGEVMAESWPVETLMDMAAMDLPTREMVQQQAMQAQMEGVEPPPPPEATLDDVAELLMDQRIRPFILDIESDSTIAPDEEADKASRMELLGALTSFVQQVGPLVMQLPQAAPFAAEMLKFTANGFRAGRELGAAVDDFSAQIEAMAQQALEPQEPPPDPAMMRAQADMEEAQMKAQLDGQRAQADMAQMQAQMQMDRERHGMEMEKLGAEIERIRMQVVQASIPRGVRDGA